MRAALLVAPGIVEVGAVADPTPGPGEVVVAVAACGICGTDLHLLDGELAPLPVVPGHELAGTVVALGADVEGVAVGDAVAVDPNLPCGSCRPCRRGRTNLCEHLAAIGITRPGGAAELVAVPAATCVVLPPGLDVADAALVEPLSCAVRGFDVLGPRVGDRFLLYGAGPMGLLLLQLATRAGAVSVDVVDLLPDRLAVATSLGARHAVGAADEVDEPGGWDVVIDGTGAIQAIEDGLGRVARGGTFLQFGVASPDAVATWSPHRVYRHEITIAGSMAVLDSFGRAVDLLAAGTIDVGAVVSARLPLDRYPDAIDRVRRGDGAKLQIVP